MVKAGQNLEDKDVIEIHDDDGNDDDIRAIIVDHASSSEEDINCMWILTFFILFSSVDD